jgi:hypothetical protein
MPRIYPTDWKTQIKIFRRLSRSAIPTDNTKYGQMYEIKGSLTGPNGKNLTVCTIWMTETATGDTKFITMYPNKGEKK